MFCLTCISLVIALSLVSKLPSSPAVRAMEGGKE